MVWFHSPGISKEDKSGETESRTGLPGSQGGDRNGSQSKARELSGWQKYAKTELW